MSPYPVTVAPSSIVPRWLRKAVHGASISHGMTSSSRVFYVGCISKVLVGVLHVETRRGQTDVDKRRPLISEPQYREGEMNEYPEIVLFPVDLCTRSRDTSQLGVVGDDDRR
jgi:hypothetical protein